MRRQVAEQVRWANDRRCEAEEGGESARAEAFYGYVQALRWVDAVVLAPLTPDSPATRELEPLSPG